MSAWRRVAGLVVVASAFVVAGCATKKADWCPPKRAAAMQEAPGLA